MVRHSYFRELLSFVCEIYKSNRLVPFAMGYFNPV